MRATFTGLHTRLHRIAVWAFEHRHARVSMTCERLMRALTEAEFMYEGGEPKRARRGVASVRRQIVKIERIVRAIG